MILYGGGGHCKVIIDIITSSGNNDITVWDDFAKGPLLGLNPIKPQLSYSGTDHFIISIGNNKVRKQIAQQLSAVSSFGTAIHPSANVAASCKVDYGTCIMAGVTINPDSMIGKHCIINTNSSVDHDCIIEDFVHISPNATLCGNITVGEGTHIGASATIIPGVKIGKWCIIGAGTTVIKDIPDFATVVGNPGRVIKINGATVL